MEPELVRVLKALSDVTRLRILNILQEGELCVCEIETLLGISQSNASRQLLKLTTAGIIRYYKKAKYVYYSLNEHITAKYPFIVSLFKDETAKLEECVQDSRRLRSYKGQGLTCEDLKKGDVCFFN